jgi:hypothetical protein
VTERRHMTDALGSVRQSADDPRVVEGIAIPYGVVSAPTELYAGSGQIIREAWAPGAFRDSIDAFAGRTDGARLPFKPSHQEKAIGTVLSLTDTSAGVAFRARIFKRAAGDEYLEAVSEGLNGVSAEVEAPLNGKAMRDGTLLHRAGRVTAIAGSVNPAYDGARIALRDMEEVMNETPAPEPTPTPAPAPEPEPTPTPEPVGANRDNVLVSRSALERAGLTSLVGSTIRITRPEAVYSPRDQFNYMADSWRQEKGDAEAAERVRRHQAHLQEVSIAIERDATNRILDPLYGERAGDVISSEIPGAYPNDYLPGLLTPRILKGRPMGDFFQRIPISDARPRIFPKVTTSGTVATFAEGVAPTATDIATTAVSVTPSAYGTYTDVSRQALDGGDPSVLSIIFQDLIEAYRQASETAIKTAVEAGASASGTAITAATPYAGELGNVIKYYATRFRPCEAAFVPSALYSVLLAQGDTTGRPFLPMIGLMNSDGSVQSGAIAGNILGASVRLSWASTVNVNVFAVPQDYVVYESSIAQFTYDQVVGPQSIRVGLWAYLGIGTRLGGLSVTAA